jgi:peptidoglycan/LPS O-acetylase OafA/YrhL
MKNARIPLSSLTALRFFAAFYIVLFHRRAVFGDQPDLVHAFVSHGFVGVPLFFVLSGFVLAYCYVDHAGRFAATAREFFVARFARIYPVYLLAFALYLPTALFTARAVPRGEFAATIWSTLTLTQGWTGLIYWNRPGWSLSDEALFYLCFPLLAPLVCARGRRGLIAAIGLFWVLGILPVVAQSLGDPDGQWLRTVKHNPLVRLPEFLTGIAFGKLFFDDSTRGAQRQRRALGCIGVALAGLVAALGIPTSGVWNLLWHNGFLAPLFGLLIYGLALGDAMIARLPGFGAVVLLGEASYGIYILQSPLHNFCMGAAAMLSGAGPAVRLPSTDSAWFVAVYVGVLVGFSILCLRWYEMPARTAVRRLLSARSPRHAPGPGARGVPARWEPAGTQR